MASLSHDVIVGLGSNIEAQKHIDEALRLLQTHYPNMSTTACVKTAPVGFKAQPDFINTAVRFKTKLQRQELKLWLKSLEATLGRHPTQNRNGPRTIDLDILVWDKKIIDKDVYSRSFLQTSIHLLWPGLLK